MEKMEFNKEIEKLYLEMFQKLYVYALAILKNEAQAEEAVQDTFRIACTKPQALLTSANPRGWLLITLKNVISNARRSQMLTNKILTGYISEQMEELAVTEDQVDFALIYENVAELEEYRILRELVIEGRSYLEMARERGISVAACRKRVQRAKEVLRGKIKNDVTI